VVNGCTHCTPENTHWTPGIIASNGCAGATPAHPAQTSGARASGAYPGRDAPAPAGASTRSGRASARTLSRFAHQDAQTLPSPRVAEGGRGMRGQTRTGMPAHPAQTSGARASGAYPGRDAPAPQGLPRAQGGLQPAPSLVLLIRTPKRPLLPVWEKGVGGMRGQTRTRRRDARAPDPHAGGGSYCQSAPGAGIALARAMMA
jgi:hypothetical protein